MEPQQQPATLSNTELHTISSSIVNDEFTISIAFPRQYQDTNTTYPVIYLLDANIFFGLVTETTRLLQFGSEIPECIIVGIGYPDDSQHLTLRTRDFTPSLYDMPEIAGGAEPFLDFLCKELKPYIEAHYRINPDDTTLIGDSTGGLFALYTLFKKPDAFNRYIIGSPSIYWDDRIILEYEERYAAAHDDLPATVFLSVGALEAIYEPAFAAMVSNVARLTEILNGRNYPNLKLTSHIFDSETHLSVIPATMGRGLRTVFSHS